MFFKGKIKFGWWECKRKAFWFLVRMSNRLFGKELTHRSQVAKWLNKHWLALTNWISPARRKQACYERENPDAPWFVPAAIYEIERELRPEFVGFEWGCGRSTLWFARRVRHITSIEGREAWAQEVLRWLAQEELLSKATVRLVKVTSEHNFNLEEIERYAGAIKSVPDYSLDFIVVDGHFREACLSHVGNKLRRGGLLIIDNSDALPATLLDKLKAGDFRVWHNGIWETTVIRNVVQEFHMSGQKCNAMK